MTASYYSTAEWKALRSQALKRDNYTCQDCGKKGKEHTYSRDKAILIVHHVIERKDGGKDELANLKTTCRECHQKTNHYGALKLWVANLRNS